MRRVVVWRHGQTEHNAGGVFQGHLDTPLSTVGEQQAQTAAAVLARLGPTRLVSSDLSRARSTAAALAGATGLTATTDRRWREIDVGAWQGRTRAEILTHDADRMSAVDAGEDLPRGGTGERVADVQVRVRAAFEELTAQLPDGEVAVVTTHGQAGRALVASVLDLSYRHLWLSLVGLRNCHWAELVEHRTGWRLDSWNVGVDLLRAPQSGR